MTNQPAPLQPAPHLPAPPTKLPTMAIPWICMVLVVASLLGEFAVINTWENGSCNIGGALLGAAGVWVFTALVPITTLVQQVRSPVGYRRVGQAVTLYVLSVLVLAPTALIAMVPILFADAC